MAITLRNYQNQLVSDIRSAINKGKHSVCAVLGCGGGKSVIIGEIARLTTANERQVLFLVHRKELCSQITNTFIASGVDMKHCEVMMVQTACRRLAKLNPPKLIIVDEAHHILSQSYMSILQYFPEAIVVGFTATPARMNEGGLGAAFQELILSVSTEWLIENHFLAPYKYYGMQLADTSKLHTKNGDFDKAEVEELMNKSAIFGSAVENWQKLAQGKKTIIYCSSIEISKSVVEAYNKTGINAAHLDGTTPQGKREATVAAFRRGEILVLSNVDLFGEGFDVPDCEAVQLLRPTKSLTLHVQQSMRSMRYNPQDPDKVAIILDHVGNFTRHGLPDDEREWTLAAKAKKKKNEVRVKQCPVCFAVLPGNATECQYCKYVFEKQERAEQKVITDVILEEISRRPHNDYLKCKTFEELDLFRRAHKYKTFWTVHKAVEMNLPIPPKYRWLAYKIKLIRGI
jgi:superfamily II DNA or RNA helicase